MRRTRSRARVTDWGGSASIRTVGPDGAPARRDGLDGKYTRRRGRSLERRSTSARLRSPRRRREQYTPPSVRRAPAATIGRESRFAVSSHRVLPTSSETVTDRCGAGHPGETRCEPDRAAVQPLLPPAWAGSPDRLSAPNPLLGAYNPPYAKPFVSIHKNAGTVCVRVDHVPARPSRCIRNSPR